MIVNIIRMRTYPLSVQTKTDEREQAMKTKGPTRTRDAELTKAQILDAAEVEFARAGLLGARTENISEPAGVTRAMIHYYYSTKEQLYRAVLERIFSNRIKDTQSLDLHNDDVHAALVEFLTSLMRQHLSNPNIAPILML